MTCRSAREDYVQSVADLCQMARHLLSVQDAYTSSLLDGSALHCDKARRQWELYLTGMARLLSEENVAYRGYVHAHAHHAHA